MTIYKSGYAIYSGKKNVKNRGEFHAYVDQEFQLKVIETNSPPQITSNPPTSINEDEVYSYKLEVNDPDLSDLLELKAIKKPDWLTFDPANGVLSGKPIDKDIGNHNINLQAIDSNGAFQNQDFVITVNDV